MIILYGVQHVLEGLRIARELNFFFLRVFIQIITPFNSNDLFWPPKFKWGISEGEQISDGSSAAFIMVDDTSQWIWIW